MLRRLIHALHWPWAFRPRTIQCFLRSAGKYWRESRKLIVFHDSQVSAVREKVPESRFPPRWMGGRAGCGLFASFSLRTSAWWTQKSKGLNGLNIVLSSRQRFWHRRKHGDMTASAPLAPPLQRTGLNWREATRALFMCHAGKQWLHNHNSKFGDGFWSAASAAQLSWKWNKQNSHVKG